MTGNQHELGTTAYLVGEAVAQLQDGKTVTSASVVVINALTTVLMREASVLNLAVRARWGADGYTFTPLTIGGNVTPGVY